jgi:3,4-dihydroxy 2-butanone 4-phosphate synthase/GTP cyclohydrolase II
MSDARSRVEGALAAVGRGDVVLIVDDESRENEGDLVVAAECADPKAVNFMITLGRGLVCCATDTATLARLTLPQMVIGNDSPHETAFTVSIDIANGGTGISATDRSNTIRAIADPDSLASDFVRPGHVFPLRAVAGGVLSRRGHTEAAVDLMKLAGLRPAAAICEILDADGEPARGPYLATLAQEYGIAMLSVADIVQYRLATSQVTRAAETVLPTLYGQFRMFGYRDGEGGEHLALVLGDPSKADAPLVRMHSECLTGDVFGSQRCDCGAQLVGAMEMIATAGNGVIVYLRGHEGRGIGLVEKLRAYALQDGGMDTVDANLALGLPIDARDYQAGTAILRDLGHRRVRLLTNNPEKVRVLEASGIEVLQRLPLAPSPTAENVNYLLTKRERMDHARRFPTEPLGFEPAEITALYA